MIKKNIKSKDYFGIRKNSDKDILNNIRSPVNYSITQDVIKGGTGKDVKICIVDSGIPLHKDIDIVGDEGMSFCGENTCSRDDFGHSTMVSGIIKAKNKNAITGMAVNSKLFYAKVVNNEGKCSFNSIVAAVLWAIVKKVDIITIALGTKYNYTILHDAIKKAQKNNICIIAASGNKLRGLDYPAKYDEVFEVRNNKKNNKLYTTYLNDKYIRASGSSIVSAYYTGLSVLLVEEYKKTIPEHEIPALVYSKLKKI